MVLMTEWLLSKAHQSALQENVPLDTITELVQCI